MHERVWWKRWRVILLAACSVGALAILWFLVARFRTVDRPVPEPEARDQPVMPAEEIVASYILDKAKDPRSVQFERWGPHDLTGDLVTHRKGNDDRIIRVRYRGKVPGLNEEVIEDNLYYLLNGEVNQVVTNFWGDDWETAMRPLNEGKPAPRIPP